MKYVYFVKFTNTLLLSNWGSPRVFFPNNVYRQSVFFFQFVTVTLYYTNVEQLTINILIIIISICYIRDINNKITIIFIIINYEECFNGNESQNIYNIHWYSTFLKLR